MKINLDNKELQECVVSINKCISSYLEILDIKLTTNQIELLTMCTSYLIFGILAKYEDNR